MSLDQSDQLRHSDIPGHGTEGHMVSPVSHVVATATNQIISVTPIPLVTWDRRSHGWSHGSLVGHMATCNVIPPIRSSPSLRSTWSLTWIPGQSHATNQIISDILQLISDSLTVPSPLFDPRQLRFAPQGTLVRLRRTLYLFSLNFTSQSI
jgi:hypothetical protein